MVTQTDPDVLLVVFGQAEQGLLRSRVFGAWGRVDMGAAELTWLCRAWTALT